MLLFRRIKTEGMIMSNQIQCANCYCTLYFTGENDVRGITGELCSSCESEQEQQYDDDDD